MALFTDVEQQVAELRVRFGVDVPAEELVQRMSAFGGDDLVDAVRAASQIVRAAERLTIVGAGLVATRSDRVAGQNGLAQSLGHRSPAALVQEICGLSFAEAQRHVRLGLAIVEADAADAGASPDGDARPPSDDDRFGAEEGNTSDAAGTGCDAQDDPAAKDADANDGDGGSRGRADFPESAQNEPESRRPWHAPLSVAMMSGRISSAQQDAIQRGLGHPVDDSDEARAAWSAAAEQLIEEARERTVEELRIEARAIRDQLDPEGAERRFAQRYERRSFRTWTDQDGIEHGRIEFEDEGAAWMRAIRDAALRPRRGGPRFVDSAEARRAEDLTADPRTNDQLGYDLLMDPLRAGALADSESVFGTRQAGVRIVEIVDTSAGRAPGVRTEDYGFSLPHSAAEQHMCASGSITVTVDRAGNPLDVGRENRLFTPRQRIALAVRDGGCRWRGCDRPASYCEAHHIDEWHRDRGRTDIDRGILLCRYHHMQLHHGGWRITRDGHEDFMLHPPGGRAAIPLRPRAALVVAWAGIDPPPKRFRRDAA